MIRIGIMICNCSMMGMVASMGTGIVMCTRTIMVICSMMDIVIITGICGMMYMSTMICIFNTVGNRIVAGMAQ